MGKSQRVQRYLKAIRREQAEAHITPKQATPIFSDKLRWLVSEIKRRMADVTENGGTFTNKYVLQRDLAFFLCLWWASDRAGDLGRTQTCEISRIDGGDFLFNHTVGKTVRESGSELVIIPKDQDELNPEGAVNDLVALAGSHGFALADGYPFRPMTQDHKRLANKPFVGGAPNRRLQLYFSCSSDPDDKGLRAHGGRAGAAATLRLLGVSEEAVMDHCRWASRKTYKHYTEVEKVTRRQQTTQVLRKAVGSAKDRRPEADMAGQFFRALNLGFGVQQAFPANHPIYPTSAGQSGAR